MTHKTDNRLLKIISEPAFDMEKLNWCKQILNPRFMVEAVQKIPLWEKNNSFFPIDSEPV